MGSQPGPTGSRRGAGKGARASVALFRFDRSRLAEAGVGTIIAGADEVGRGCLAGPLVAAAVALDYRKALSRSLAGLTDSKLLTAKTRAELYDRIILAAARVCLVAVSPASIDERGLHRSNLAALAGSLEGMRGAYDLALVDGFALERPDLRAERVVGGDRLSAAVAAASVVAKVTRDRLMRSLDPGYPPYGFAEHVGYATKRHREAIREYGICMLHRRSFVGVGDTQLELWEDR